MLKTQKAIEEDPEQAAEAAGLRYVSDQKPGMTRRKKGRGFVYYDQNGHRIKGGALLKRIRSIVIPPAWERVWICPSVNGHLQATGFDTKGRKQYKYHSTCRLVRDEAKFERLLLFAGVLPKLRARVNRDMRRTDLSREKIVATVVRLLELSLIRVGNEE